MEAFTNPQNQDLLGFATFNSGAMDVNGIHLIGFISEGPEMEGSRLF